MKMAREMYFLKKKTFLLDFFYKDVSFSQLLERHFDHSAFWMISKQISDSSKFKTRQLNDISTDDNSTKTSLSLTRPISSALVQNFESELFALLEKKPSKQNTLVFVAACKFLIIAV